MRRVCRRGYRGLDAGLGNIGCGKARGTFNSVNDVRQAELSEFDKRLEDAGH